MKKDTKNNKLLTKEVAVQFEVVDWKGGHAQEFGKFGLVDLKTLTIAQAERLVKFGFSKLRKKKPTVIDTEENSN